MKGYVKLDCLFSNQNWNSILICIHIPRKCFEDIAFALSMHYEHTEDIIKIFKKDQIFVLKSIQYNFGQLYGNIQSDCGCDTI